MSYSCANPHKGHHVAHSNHSDSQHEKSSNPHFRSKRKPGKGAVRDVSNKNDHKIISRINTSVADREGVVNYSRAVRIKNSSVSQTGDKKGRTKPNTHAISVISLSRNDEGGPRITKPSATATKRKHSAVELGQRMEDKIEQKIEDFRVLSGCLEEYVLEERRNHNDVSLQEIIKMIQAFNRSEIKAISKPLERLIRDIVDSIRRSLPDKRTEQIGTPTRMIRTPDAQVKSILKKPSEFESPAYGRGMHSVSDILDTELKQGSHPGPPVGSTVKKAQRKESEPKIFTAGPPRQGFTSDFNKLQQNLSKLKYESNRLKYFFEQVTAKKKLSREKDEEHVATEEKQRELRELKEIVEKQARIIEDLQQSSGEHTFREEGEE